MPDTEQDPIIVTGRFGGGFFSSWGFDPLVFQGGLGSFYVGGLTLASFYAANPKHLKIPGSAEKPETATNNLNSSQLAAVLAALDNADKDAGLSSSFKEMAEKGVKMSVTVQSQIPDWFEDPAFQAAGVRFNGTDSNGDGKADTFSLNTAVEIVIIAGRFNGITAFKHHLAHELTHLIKGSSGNFLSETGVLQRENQTREFIFSSLNETDYNQSMDYAVAMPGNQVNYYGTDGNNLFTEAGSFNQIYTGGGNDIITSGESSDLIVVNGSGLKFVIDYGAGWDVLEANTIPSMSNVIWTRVGLDLYITSNLAGTSPTSDPNAIILLDWYAMGPYGHIDYLKTADGNLIVLVDVAGQGVPAGSSMDSSTDEVTLSPDNPTALVTQEFRSTSPRYEGISTYTSHTVDPADILLPWEAMAIAQLLQAPPSDDVEMFRRALGDDRPLSVQIANMSLNSGSMLEPMSLPEVAFVV